MKIEHLAGWIPIRYYWQNGQPMLDWCQAGNRRFSDPFLERDIEIILQHPFNMIFRHQTGLDAVVEFCKDYPGLKPTGFILHIGRCGSTVISQMFGASRRNIVISEPGVIDLVLKSNRHYKLFTDDQRVDVLRAIVSVFGQRRFEEESDYFIKFDNWAILDLPLIRQAFPDVPWVFVYRDPVPVMVSNLKDVAGKSYPMVVDPAILGLDIQTVAGMRFEEYLAITISRFCQMASNHLDDKAILVNYSQLPDFVFSDLLPFFGLDYSKDEIEAMKKISGLHAKRPSMPYRDDTAAKERDASDFVRQMADKWITPVYQELEAKRTAQYNERNC